MRLPIFIAALFFLNAAYCQNVGIGTTTPGFPLNFANTLGDKISLWGNSGNHYGFGVQSGVLQIHTDVAASNIAFGYGTSSSFSERMRILNAGGYDGLVVNGRLLLKNGSFDFVGGGGGVWLYKPDNSAQLGFMGTQNSQNIGFYGGPAGWGFTYDAVNSRVGIGNNNPNAPLAFPPSLGKKITLYPGATGDVGFGVAGNRLQIFSDNPNADVAIGYDAAGTFNERFAVKPNGAIAVNGSTGTSGQLLQSNGNGSAATWVSKPYVLSYAYSLSVSSYLTGAGVTSAPIQGLDNQSFTLQQPSSIVFMANLNFTGDVYTASYGYLSVKILNNSNQVVASGIAWGQALADSRHTTITAFASANIPAGFYHTQVLLVRNTDSDGNFTIGGASAVIQVFPN